MICHKRYYRPIKMKCMKRLSYQRWKKKWTRSRLIETSTETSKEPYWLNHSTSLNHDRNNLTQFRFLSLNKTWCFPCGISSLTQVLHNKWTGESKQEKNNSSQTSLRFCGASIENESKWSWKWKIMFWHVNQIDLLMMWIRKDAATIT